ncbi:MHO_4530 family protein [Mycoplasmopsis columbina]|uniref:MHO_4530 family protein n=1 Tax=Mycoplasmopsis columbina TaxID=114881 RepID=UPI0004A6CE0F|nr:hypothetical protein [Mycoplasmopsis columbina]VEU76960.1 Uncharacterised protein [Mycoplasmopsis columbina]
MNSTSIILISLAVIILITLIFTSIFILLGKLKQVTTNGLIIFRIDNERKTIVRLSSTKMSSQTNFDSTKLGIEMSKYYDLNSFLSFFKDEIRNQIVKFLEENENNENIITFYGHLQKDNITNLSTKRLFNLLKIKKFHENIHLKIFRSKEDNKLYCSLYWNLKVKNQENNKFQKLEDFNNLVENVHENFLISIALEIKQEYLIKDINDNFINKIITLLDLNSYRGFWKLENNNLFIFLSINNELKLKKLNKLLSNKCNIFNNTQLFKFYINKLVYSNSLKLQNSNDLEELKIKIQFLMLNYKKSSSWLLNQSFDEYQAFKDELKYFETKINHLDFIKEVYDVINIQTNLKESEINMARITGFDKDKINFYQKQEYYRNLALPKQNSFLLQNHSSQYPLAVFTNAYDLEMNYEKIYRNNSMILILKNIDSSFNLNALNNFFERKNDDQVQIALYIDKLDNISYNFIRKNSISWIVIGENISKYLNFNTNYYLKLLNFLEIFRDLKFKIIYENLPEKLDRNIIQKLNIKYKYNK